MDLREVLLAIRRHWWLVAGALMAALGVAGLATTLAVPQYATYTTFFVTAPAEGVSDAHHGGLLSQSRARTYSHMFGGELARLVSEADGVDLTHEQVQARIRGEAVYSTTLLEVVVTDSDRIRSERVANVMVREFISLVERLETPPDRTTPIVKVEVVAGPELNPVPVSPNPVRNGALAVALGLLLGVAAAMLKHRLDATVKTADVLQHLTDAPVLTVVPFDSGVKKHSPLVAGSQRAATGARRNGSYAARGEAYRHLRTNLQFVDVEHPARVIAVTSSELGEGKSTTAANLAITLAEAGRRVALVEADLRRPRVAEYLGLEMQEGLSNVLAGQVAVNAVMQRWGTHELYVLPSGPVPPNPSELLASQRMAVLVESLRESFDVVIVDTPPVLPFTDAAVVAASADGVVLVVRAGKTHQGRIRRAVASLQAVDARLLGCVLNMHAERSDEGYYYDGHRYRNHHRPVSPAFVLPLPTSHTGNGAAADVTAGSRR